MQHTVSDNASFSSLVLFGIVRHEHCDSKALSLPAGLQRARVPYRRYALLRSLGGHTLLLRHRVLLDLGLHQHSLPERRTHTRDSIQAVRPPAAHQSQERSFSNIGQRFLCKRSIR